VFSEGGKVEHYPLTDEQRRDVSQELATMIHNLKNIASLLRACGAEMDMAVYRAEEAGGAVQRLVWAIERRNAKQQHASG
jgi:hypothetical protein